MEVRTPSGRKTYTRLFTVLILGESSQSPHIHIYHYLIHFENNFFIYRSMTNIRNKYFREKIPTTWNKAPFPPLCEDRGPGRSSRGRPHIPPARPGQNSLSYLPTLPCRLQSHNVTQAWYLNDSNYMVDFFSTRKVTISAFHQSIHCLQLCSQGSYISVFCLIYKQTPTLNCFNWFALISVS